MSELKNSAIEKLKKEYTEGKKSLGRAAVIMADGCLQALTSFINQDEEFADAVLQNSQTFINCMAVVEKNCGSGISDFEAYKRAVQFYFPGAEIEFCMKIHVNPFDLEQEEKSETFKTFSLLDII